MENKNKTDHEIQEIVYEALIHLARMKSTLTDRLLLPAGVPAEIYERAFVFLPTGTLTLAHRQQASAQILSGILALPARRILLRRLIDLTMSWSEFELAEDPQAAAATVRRARRLVEHMQFSQPVDDLRAELDLRTDITASSPAETALQFINPDEELLLRMWQDVLLQSDPDRQSWLVQDLVNRLFLLHEITMIQRFHPTPDQRVIEGLIQLSGVKYPVEVRWQRPYEQTLAGTIQLHADDLSSVLAGAQDLRTLLEAKI